MPALDDDFTAPLAAGWHRATPGGGTLDVADSVLRCALPPTLAGHYANAQIDDYGGARLARYPWRPPLRMEVRARTSMPIHPRAAVGPRRADTPASVTVEPSGTEQTFLRGTVGFGFWNAPMTAARGALRLPDAVWFFGASPPSQMRLVPGLPGCGWKAQVVHANRAGALAYGTAALGAAGWARLTGRERAAARLVERMTGASEAVLATDSSVWHDYALEWDVGAARFFVDGAEVLRAPHPPHGPLGFVAWIDNQYAVATPRGELRFGTLAIGPQWLELDAVRITPLSPTQLAWR